MVRYYTIEEGEDGEFHIYDLGGTGDFSGSSLLFFFARQSRLREQSGWTSVAAGSLFLCHHVMWCLDASGRV